MSYQGYEGWFKEHTTSLSTGKFWLTDEYAVELGEPVCYHSDTGFEANPKNKKKIKSYDNATAGLEHAFGVSLDIRYQKSGVDTTDLVMRPDRYTPREITVMKIGICPIKNTSTGTAIMLDDTVIPSDGGCETIAAHGTGAWDAKYTLGKALEEIQPTHRGLVWVNPQSFEKNAHDTDGTEK